MILSFQAFAGCVFRDCLFFSLIFSTIRGYIYFISVDMWICGYLSLCRCEANCFRIRIDFQFKCTADVRSEG